MSVRNSGDTITLLQERYVGDPWAVLFASLCLKRTTRAQAEDVVVELLDRYSTPELLLTAEQDEVETRLRPLGLWRTRADELVQIADRLSDEGPPETRAAALELHGVGEYVANSYAIFVLCDRSVDPNDEKLREFLDE